MRGISGPVAAAVGLLASLLLPATVPAQAAGVAPEAATPLPDGRPLVFASDEWCPYVCFESTQPGYLVELTRAVFESPARPVEIRRMSWARAVREAEAGRIDGVLGAAVGESESLVYPARPAAGDPVSFAVMKDDPWAFDGIRALANRRIGVAEGYRFGPPFDATLFPDDRPAPGVEALSTDHPTWSNLQKLVGGRVDTVLDNGHVLRHEIERRGFFPAVRVIDTGVEHPIFIAFSANPTGRALATHFDRALREREGQRAVSTLESEYGPMDAPQ
ncbi:MAG: substrate-binding periplasmic protein [Silanimonas sp.]